MATARTWWKEAVCYQVWPASFKDSNGDGMGDIRGVTSKLDYLKDLGIDAIWISPMYDSPRNDMGYDVRDYEAVDASFGTLQDMDDLIKGLHDRGMRLLLDLVVNHTSDEHKWFQASKQSRENVYADYYIWRDGKVVDGQRVEPNNWASIFGGSAWKYVAERDQYYLHLFHESQPDVNWELKKVRQDMYQTSIKFWLDRGVDGFRVDAVILYSKDLTFPDAEVVNQKAKYHGPNFEAIVDGPKMHEWLKEQRQEAIDPYGQDIVLVGEASHLSTEEQVLQYINPKDREMDMIFDMSVVFHEGDYQNPADIAEEGFKLARFRKGWVQPQSRISEHGCWSSVFLENHDNPRSVDRFGSSNPKLRNASAKLLATLLATLSGTLFLYQGEEIGMTGVPTSWPISDWRDEPVISWVRETEQQYGHDVAMNFFKTRGRDHSRTPVQWSAETNAGFTTGTPWMRVNDNFAQAVNVADQERDPDSILSYWKKVVSFRKQFSDLFIYGHTRFIDVENEKILLFTKRIAGKDSDDVLVVLNFTDEIQPFQPEQVIEHERLYEVMLSTSETEDSSQLQPREGRVYRLI